MPVKVKYPSMIKRLEAEGQALTKMTGRPLRKPVQSNAPKEIKKPCTSNNQQMPIDPSISNIEMSRRRVDRIRSEALSSFKTFRKWTHLYGCSRNTALKLYFESKMGQVKVPGIHYQSYSVASRIIPNIICKTQLLNVMIADHYLNHDFKKSDIEDFKECGKNLTFAEGKDSNNRNHHHLIGGFMCDFKYCSVNQYLKARERTEQISTILKYLYDRYNWEPIFITFTIKDIKNPTPYKVRKAVNKLDKGVRKLMKYKRYNGDNRFFKSNKGIIKGWIEKNESTYKNKENTMHPHVHVIGMVRKSYLNKYGSKYWIPKSQWKADWKRVCNISYDPIVSIKVPYYKNKLGKEIKISECHNKADRNKCLQEAATEIAKYTAKSVDYAKEPRLYGKISHKKVNKWSKKTYNIDLTKTDWHTKNIITKNYLENKLTKDQVNSVNAFHAICKGMKNIKALRFGGWCQKANRMYNSGALDAYIHRPKVTYYYRIDSKFIFKEKDYLDVHRNLTKQDVRTLKKQGQNVKPIDIKTKKPLYKKHKKSALEIMKSIPNYLIRKWDETEDLPKQKWFSHIMNKAYTELSKRSNANALNLSD